MKSKKNIIWLILFVAGTVWILMKRNEGTYHSNNGLIFGTIYNITYQYTDDLQMEIEAELKRFDGSLSPFNQQSIISRVNRNEEIMVDSFFQVCFDKAVEVSKATNGAFDITVAPLANAWGFGFKKGVFPDSAKVDSLLEITGYEKAWLKKGMIEKSDIRVQLSCSAIAKGYAVDVVANYLNSKGVKNYLVDIGGEIVAKGRNSRDGLWQIGRAHV